MLQITFTAEQVSWAKEAIIIPLATWFFRWSISTLRKSLNEIITDNVNRIKKELMEHIDDKFQEHETSAFSRIAALEAAVKGK